MPEADRATVGDGLDQNLGQRGYHRRVRAQRDDVDCGVNGYPRHTTTRSGADGDDHVALLDRHGKRFSHVWPLLQAGHRRLDRLESGAGLDDHVVSTHADLAGVEPRLAGAHVELPAVPWTAQDLTRTAVGVLPR